MDRRLLACFDDLCLRVVHRARLQGEQLAVDKDLVTDVELVLQPRQVPPAAVEARRAVVEDELEDRLGALGVVVHSLRDDFAEHGGRLVQLELRNGAARRPPVLVATRLVEQQVFQRHDAKLGEALHMPRPHAAQGGDGTDQRVKFVGHAANLRKN